MPTGSRDRIDPGAPRTHQTPTDRPAPAPRAYRPEPARGLLGTLAGLFKGSPSTAPTSRRINCLHCSHTWRTTAAPGNSIRCPECSRMRRVPTGTATPRPQAPAPAPVPPRAVRPAPRPVAAPTPPQAPRPARPAAGPIDVDTLDLREQNRRTRVGQLVRSLGSNMLVWYNQPPGACEALDTTLPSNEQRCPRPIAVRVEFRNGPTEAPAYACLAHGARLASLADRSPYITATAYPLRAR
ncbi:hypothetical protein [Streptomyces sp. NPDC101249]|uniref:hypothetical protein n=1 Tax=Streptomyces sp. NPDC101249 TaxID=3366140 RepID=UPI00381B4F25